MYSTSFADVLYGVLENEYTVLSSALTKPQIGICRGSSRRCRCSAASFLYHVPVALVGQTRSPRALGSRAPQPRRVRWDLRAISSSGRSGPRISWGGYGWNARLARPQKAASRRVRQRTPTHTIKRLSEASHPVELAFSLWQKMQSNLAPGLYRCQFRRLLVSLTTPWHGVDAQE